jgi:SPP1 family predicted phage head-tail adaptor
MRAGPLRQVITIQTLTEAADPYGQRIQSWHTLGNFRSEIRNFSLREMVNAKQVKAETTHIIRTRWIGSLFPSGELPPGSRILYWGRVFNVLGRDNIENRNREYRILAQEITKPT